MQRHEEHHHTPEQIAGHLDDALAILAGTEVPDDLREAAFTQVFSLLAAKQIFFDQPQRVPVDLSQLRPNHDLRR